MGNARSGGSTSTTVVHPPQQSYGLQPQQSYSLTATVLVQNEARWLPEWLEYHLLPVIGVEHFYLYDDDSNGIGSIDELDSTLAPYVDAGLLTAHKVSALGPLPRHGIKTTDMRMCSRTTRPWVSYRRVGSMCEREPFHFPQQAVVIQHAAATYGNKTRAMLLIDVDEFLAYEPSRNRYSARSAATALAVALSGRVGAVKLESHVMLPDRLSWGGASDDRLFLTRNYSRQLLQPVSREERLRKGQLCFRKNVVDPRALGVLDGLHYYATIHVVALRGDKVQKVTGHSLGLSLLHFRYRSATEFVARRNRTYMQAGAHGSAEKHAVMEKWQASLTEAMRSPQTHSKPQLALLPHWAALAAALVRRWRQRKSDATPSAVLTLLNEAALVTSRVSVLLVSEPRSGSTLVGKLSFDARTDFLYSYEPCRMKAHQKSHSDGTFFGRDCALWAGAVLRCGLSLGDFNMLRRDKGSFAAQSSSSVRVLSARLDGDEVEAYLGWMRRCWSSHRAAKVIRIREPAALSALMSLGDERLKIIHLTRDPERVVASRLSLRAFMRRGYFNPRGGHNGVVRATCDGMNAMAAADMVVAPSELQRYEYEELLSSPFEFLRRLYSWLGLDVTIPESVMCMARQCRLGNQTGPALAKRRRFRVCELAPATGTRRKAPTPPKVQLSGLQRRQVMAKCHKLFHIMRSARERAPSHWSMRDLANLTRSSVVGRAQPIEGREELEATPIANRVGVRRNGRVAGRGGLRARRGRGRHGGRGRRGATIDGTSCELGERCKSTGHTRRVNSERAERAEAWAERREESERVRVPRDIYMLWDKGFESAPAYQKACLASWIHFNPTWTVHAMNMAEAEHLASISDISAAARKMYAKMKIEAKSDVIRTRIMLLHGGVWADASLACNKPLDEFLPEDVRFYAFVRHDPTSKIASTTKHHIPIKPWVASWFLASERHSGVFEVLWHAVEAFWAELADVTHADYFWWHETVARLFHEDEDFKRAVNTLPSADPVHCIRPDHADHADHAPMYKRCQTEVTLRKFGPKPKQQKHPPKKRGPGLGLAFTNAAGATTSQQIRFLVISRARSASTTLVRALEATPGVTCLHELLNQGATNIPFLSDRLIAYSRFSTNASTEDLTRLRRAVGVTSHAAAMADLPAFMTSFWRWCPTASCGFKVFDKQACAPLTSSHFVSRPPLRLTPSLTFSGALAGDARAAARLRRQRRWRPESAAHRAGAA